jgi:hypothetical protein
MIMHIDRPPSEKARMAINQALAAALASRVAESCEEQPLEVTERQWRSRGQP